MGSSLSIFTLALLIYIIASPMIALAIIYIYRKIFQRNEA